MDHVALVKAQFDDGQALIDELTRESMIDLAVALWVKRFEAGYWSLYLGSMALASMNIGDAFQLINRAMGRISPKAIGLADLMLVPPTDPIAANAIELRNRRPDRLPYWVYEPAAFNDPSIQTACIYPTPMGQMSREQVIQAIARLMSRTGAFSPSSITLRDGSSLQAVPTGIQLGVPGELRIVLHDLVGNTDRTISADEVVSIH